MRTKKLLTIVIYLGLVLFGNIALADVYNQVSSIRPDLSESKRIELAYYIDEACRDYKLQCDLFTAMLARESMFKVGAVNKRTQDFGIGQLNVKTIKAYKFDKHRILTDLKYSIRCSAQVLSWFKRYKREGSNWFCHYNVGSAKITFKNIKSCERYVAGVQQYQFVTIIAEQ